MSKEGKIRGDKIDRILFRIILIISSIFIILGIFVYYQSHKILSMFNNESIQESQENKVISGKIIKIKNNSIIIQDNSEQMVTEKEIIITGDTKIYQDFNSDRVKTEKADRTFLKVDSEIVIGLINSKDEIPLTAKVIHILPVNLN